MRRRQLNKTNISSSFNDTIHPEVLIGQIWINSDPRENGVKITELNSSYSSSDEKDDEGFHHAWSFINHSAAGDDQYKTFNNDNKDYKRTLNEQGESSQEHDVADYIYTNKNNANIKRDIEKMIINHEIRCLKMLNNQLVFGSDSSEDDFDEMMRLEDEYNNARREYENNNEADDIWVYANNSKRVLSDHDFLMLNIPGNDTNESLTDDLYEPKRIATPPANYIPRLNLSLPMLPTVTEVTEPNKVSNEKVIFKGNVPITPTSVNSWVGSDIQEKPKNLISWMKLSPKDPKINSNSISQMNKQLSALVEENKDSKTVVHDSEKLKVIEYDEQNKSNHDDQSSVDVIIETDRTVASQKRNNSPIIPDKLNLTFSNHSADTNLFQANSNDNTRYKSDKNVADLVDVTLLRYPSLDKSTQTGDLTYIVVPPLHLSLANSDNQTSWFTRTLECFCCCKSKRRQ